MRMAVSEEQVGQRLVVMGKRYGGALTFSFGATRSHKDCINDWAGIQTTLCNNLLLVGDSE